MEGEAKENDLRPISDRISGTIRSVTVYICANICVTVYKHMRNSAQTYA